MNNYKKIPVVWGLDEKYVLQAFVVMRSVLMNSKEDYHFFILTADNIEEEVENYTEILREEYDNFEISVKKVHTGYFSEAQIHNAHLSKAAYFRLLISEIVSEYDKCIYLDCDLIVHGDLKELYDTKLENNYLAGVRDCHIMEDTPRQVQHQEILGLPSRNRYVNSGVLVMNLEKIRNDGLAERFFEQLKQENWYEDQDVLNVCCYPKIKILPLKFNLFHFYMGKSIKFLYDLPYEVKSFDFDHERPYILHMGANYKPWNSLSVKGSKEWWCIAEVFSKCKSYQYYRWKCQETETHNEICDIIERARKSRYVVVWGYGVNGRKVCDILLEYGLDHLIIIVDSDEKLWGMEYRGIPIKGLHFFRKEYENIFWIISCLLQSSYIHINTQLKAEGVDEGNIFRYVNWYQQRMYLLSLDESAYDKEIAKIADMEYVLRIPYKDERRKYIKNVIQHPQMFAEEYAYLDRQYCFRYWIQLLNEN